MFSRPILASVPLNPHQQRLGIFKLESRKLGEVETVDIPFQLISCQVSMIILLSGHCRKMAEECVGQIVQAIVAYRLLQALQKSAREK
jgi:hypothetical protein